MYIYTHENDHNSKEHEQASSVTPSDAKNSARNTAQPQERRSLVERTRVPRGGCIAASFPHVLQANSGPLHTHILEADNLAEAAPAVVEGAPRVEGRAIFPAISCPPSLPRCLPVRNDVLISEVSVSDSTHEY